MADEPEKDKAPTIAWDPYFQGTSFVPHTRNKDLEFPDPVPEVAPKALPAPPPADE